MDELLLTYIIPLYNTEHYVLRCLHSIVNQQLWPNDYEVLVVDDGSTDGSKSVVETFVSEHPQVKLLTQENSGVSAARNLALDNARGRYVMFVDSDDRLGDDVVHRLLQHAVDDDLDVLSFNYSCEDSQGNVLPHTRDDNYGSITMDREVMSTRDSLIDRYANLIYNGFWFAPEREFIQAAITKSQENVTGDVRLKLYKGNAFIVGRRSPYTLYDPEVVTFEADDVYNQQDATGFIKLNALRLRINAKANTPKD